MQAKKLMNYYTKREIDESILCVIIQDNKFICEPYQLEEVEIKQIDKKKWEIQLDGEVLGSIEIERNLLMRKICYIWDKKKLERRYKIEN